MERRERAPNLIFQHNNIPGIAVAPLLSTGGVTGEMGGVVGRPRQPGSREQPVQHAGRPSLDYPTSPGIKATAPSSKG